MSKANIKDEVIFVFKKVFENAPEVSEFSSVEDIKEWDSLNHMILINSLEKKFNITFDLFQLIEMRSVKDFIEYINQKLENGSQGG
ncbi:MAG: acyl carrier protein [Prolixibacteraceae bacterium]|nr:acyl carrier protein [Prolixibacteraceae bacterium]MBN2774695.1 acyl carrier protein [Prolixibacteraceae bacterium]